jgi:hypothetical protein
MPFNIPTARLPAQELYGTAASFLPSATAFDALASLVGEGDEPAQCPLECMLPLLPLARPNGSHANADLPLAGNGSGLLLVNEHMNAARQPIFPDPATLPSREEAVAWLTPEGEAPEPTVAAMGRMEYAR